MRWLYADNGPAYCAACKATRRASTECDECTRPEILPECVDAVMLFRAARTQWRRDADGALLGLEYPGVESAARAMGVEWSRDVFAQVSVLEAEALAISGEKRNPTNQN